MPTISVINGIKASQEVVDKVLAVYYPNYRYLKEAEIDYPLGKGKFQLGQTGYCETLQHMTDVEAQLCLNQLCYVFFGQMIIDKRWEGLEDLTFEEYLESGDENMFIVESHKKFKKKTNPKEPFYGQIELIKTRRHDSIYVARLDFDLNGGASIGKLSLILKR